MNTVANFFELFPNYQLKDAAEVNLDQCAQRWLREHPYQSENELIWPKGTQSLVDLFHKENGKRWSWGGYLEERTSLLKGSYLDATGNYLHLGIDCNLPAGTEVVATFGCRVLLRDTDFGVNWGWGPRLIVEPLQAGQHEGQVIIFAHLIEESLPAIGAVLEPGAQIGLIGEPPSNGNWFPHLHIQAVERPHFQSLKSTGLEMLDGYGHPSNKKELNRLYPDPKWVMQV